MADHEFRRLRSLTVGSKKQQLSLHLTFRQGKNRLQTIHIELSPQEAMTLLHVLREAQGKQGWPDAKFAEKPKPALRVIVDNSSSQDPEKE